jgi:hypothetical protein
MPKSRDEFEAIIAALRRGEFPEIVRIDAFVGQLLESQEKCFLIQIHMEGYGVRT